MVDKRILIDRTIYDIKIRNKTFQIGFISNYMIREYSKIVDMASRASSLYNSFLKAKESNNVKRMQELEEAIREVDRSKYFERRMDLVKEILIENGQEFDFNFWDRKTEPSDIMQFLRMAIHKDNTDKKKLESR